MPCVLIFAPSSYTSFFKPIIPVCVNPMLCHVDSSHEGGKASITHLTKCQLVLSQELSKACSSSVRHGTLGPNFFLHAKSFKQFYLSLVLWHFYYCHTTCLGHVQPLTWATLRFTYTYSLPFAWPITKMVGLPIATILRRMSLLLPACIN